MLKNFFNRIRSYIEEKTKNELNKDEYEFLYIHQGGLLGNISMKERYKHKFDK